MRSSTMGTRLTIASVLLFSTQALLAMQASDPVLTEFQSAEGFEFSAEAMARIDEILDRTHARVAEDFPALTAPVSVTVVPVDRPALNALGGVTGRADRPDQLLIEISWTYPEGVIAAVEGELASTFAHELHHTVRGWVMEGNHYGYGIQIAAINEGLATVYAEELFGRTKAADQPPAEVADWAEEVLALPRASDYGQWMFSHPDGREAIGYRTGRWAVRQAMARSGLDIVALTERTPDAIWRLAGFDWDRQLR
ncbi:hypothetical protein WM2015_2653 [Wenzhouxiangella marina]|uniref:DUF2268 domain-containing protein n=2 Tax=Wenzhouxiangella marina TaxID=1579979 RepID=A0A0K0XZG3_9GAMM|nr:hypothetical protein WM2015_2653 [Wenzhouxiangella marina]